MTRSRLGDKSETVRKNALMVLIHLILNDMLKAKGPVIEIAKCLKDGNPAINGLAHLFFQVHISLQTRISKPALRAFHPPR
jgi:hypothetical protein